MAEHTPIPGTLGYFHRGWKTLPRDLDRLFRASRKLADVAKHAKTLCVGLGNTSGHHDPGRESCCMTCDLYNEAIAALALLD